MNWETILTSILSSLITSGLGHFYFKEVIKAKLKKDVDKEIENLKHELDVKKEIVKNDLQRDAYKTQLMVTNIHQIYPELTQKVELAFGTVGALQGVRFSTDFSQMNEEDLRSFMANKKFPKSKDDEILKLFQSDKKSAIKNLNDFLRDIEIQEARLNCVDANNFRIIKSIYCSDEVLTAFDECYSSIWSAWVDLDIGRMDPTIWQKGVTSIRKDVPQKMENLRRVIRTELRADKT